MLYRWNACGREQVRGFLPRKEKGGYKLRDLPPGDYQISVVGKPERFSENGVEMFRISPVASERMTLDPGDEAEVRFDRRAPR
jgi:hypothetical protein